MRSKIFVVALLGMLCGALAVPTKAQAALLPQQVEAVIALLAAFGADNSVITNVRASLGAGTTAAAPTAAGSLGFAPGTQPTALTLDPGTKQIPFTTLYLLNNTQAPVEIYTLTVERQGTASDSYLSSVTLTDGSGTTLGVGDDFDTRHQATLAGNGLTILAGASATLTVYGDLTNKNPSSNKNIALTVVAINASAPLLGTLPVLGTLHTID